MILFVLRQHSLDEEIYFQDLQDVKLLLTLLNQNYIQSFYFFWHQNLYYLKYTQESEVYVEANSEEEAQEKIEEYTKNGGENMYNIRLNHCGWRVKNSYTDLKPVDDRGDFEHSHTSKIY